MSPALKCLCGAVFILAAVPRLNISVGPVPVYAIDVLLFGALYYGGLNRPRWLGKIPNAGLVLAILTLALISELVGLIVYGTVVETVYMSARMCLVISLFFTLNNLIRDEADLRWLLRAATAGMLVTASLMIMTSLPITRGMVSWIFGIDQLTPVGERFFDAHAATNRGVRGQSLVGYNIISAWFVVLIWPMAIALLRSERRGGLWHKIALTASILAPFGILFSYSRGAILGMVLVIAALLIFGEGRLKSQIAVALTIVVGVIGFVGLDSNLFFFERLERRTRATLEAPLQSEMESERFRSYVDPFVIAADNPMVILAGEGLTKGRAQRRGYLDSSTNSLFRIEGNPADHSVFGKATLTYGMAAAFCYLSLFAFSLLNVFHEARIALRQTGLARTFPQLAFASAFGIAAWVAFDKGIIIQPRGAMMFFLVMALAGICRNLRVSHALEEMVEEDEEEEFESDNFSRSHGEHEAEVLHQKP